MTFYNNIFMYNIRSSYFFNKNTERRISQLRINSVFKTTMTIFRGMD